MSLLALLLISHIYVSCEEQSLWQQFWHDTVQHDNKENLLQDNFA